MSSPFARDRFTWLAYWMLAYFAYMQTALGPLMPFLRDELDLSYTVSGLHLSAFAAGMALAGVVGDHLARRWGRDRVLWGGGVGMALGALLFVVAQRSALTIASALIMGLPGTLVMIMVQAALSDRHGARRAIPLTESNIAASVSAGLAPLMVGTLERVGIGWRGALVLGALSLIGLALHFRGEPIPDPADAPESDAPPAAPVAPLPAIYWVYWLVVFLSVSVEWCVVFWGADFMDNTVGLSKEDASTLMTVFFAAMVIGRVSGSRLSRALPIGPLLLGAALVAVTGFFPFWLAPLSALNIAGLFLAGLGIANLFPLTLSTASGAVPPRQVNAASSRITLAAGLAILITPQVLGSLADQIGIRSAFAVAAAFLLVATGAIWVANRLAQRRA